MTCMADWTTHRPHQEGGAEVHAAALRLAPESSRASGLARPVLSQHQGGDPHDQRLHRRPLNAPDALPEQVRHPRPRRSPLCRPHARLWPCPPQGWSRLPPTRRHPLHLLRTLHHRRSPPSRRQVLRRTDWRGFLLEFQMDDFCKHPPLFFSFIQRHFQ